jgi:SecD/SecF fusion protein
MQGKGVIKFFAILLAAVCLYQLSFTWVAYKVRKDAEVYAKGDTTKEKAYLDSIATQPVYPILKHTYQYCQARELALGLDLKGGMNVTMQISLRELVKSLSNNNNDVVFNQALANADADQKSSQQDYITLFVNEYQKLNPNGKLAAIFATKDNQDQLKYNASNSEVETFLKNQASVKVQQSYTVLSTRIDQFGVTQPNISLQKGTNRILIELPGVKDPDRVQKLLSGTAKLEFYKTYDNAQVAPILEKISMIVSSTVKSTSADSSKLKKDTSRVKTIASLKGDTTKSKTLAGLKGDTSKKSGGSLLSQLKKASADSGKVKGKAALNNANSLFGKNALIPNLAQTANGVVAYPGPVVGFAAINDTAKVNKILALPQVKSAMPTDLRLLWGVKPISDEQNKRFGDNIKRFELFAIKLSGAENGPVLTGDVVNDARSEVDQLKGGYEVEMTMNSNGAQRWRVITAEAAANANDKKSIAIVLDNNVYSAPTVQNEIAGGVSSISGNFTLDDTKDLANVLKAGRLPAPAHIVSKAIVGPELGQQAINDSLLSSIIGFLVVLVFMIAYYNRAGTVAVVAVIINVFFLMGVLTSLGAVLTVPGVAGIVLTLGIAVDANVLIYERVREEMAGGKSLRLSISDGFKHALSSILDSNISTLLTGVILIIFGSGPIKGFATTLIIGIITSLFCSLLISRVIFEWMIEKGWDVKFSNPWSSHTFKNANYAFVKNRFKFYIFSGVFILAGIVSIATRGFNYGVDFQGGRVYVVKFAGKAENTDQVRDAVDKYFGKGKAVVKTYGADKLSISTNYMIDSTSSTADAQVLATLKKGLNEVSPNYTIPEQEKVDSTIADGLKKSAVWTVIFTILIISAYILIRFRKWQFSLGAMIATLHDALMVLAFFSLFKDAFPFSLNIDQAFIAAILTVIGYSINDTVVVFDRIREFLDLHHAKTDEPKHVINQAINRTLSRTIITALTVLFVLIVLFVFGGDVIRGFSFALLIGVCFGTYSSICIATPVIIDFGKKDLR